MAIWKYNQQKNKEHLYGLRIISFLAVWGPWQSPGFDLNGRWWKPKVHGPVWSATAAFAAPCGAWEIGQMPCSCWSGRKSSRYRQGWANCGDRWCSLLVFCVVFCGNVLGWFQEVNFALRWDVGHHMGRNCLLKDAQTYWHALAQKAEI